MELIRHTGKREQVLITGMRTFKKVLESATVGDNVGCALEGVNQSLIERGAVLVAPGSMTLSTTLQGAVYLHLLEEAGANTSLQDGQKVQCFIWTRYVVGTIKMPQEREPLQPGNWGYVKLELAEETALEIGSSFTLHNLRFGTIGTCLVVGLEASIPHQ